MLRCVGVQFLDIPEFSRIEAKMRQSNSSRDRLIRVKLEAYCSKSSALRNHNLQIDSNQAQSSNMPLKENLVELESPPSKRSNEEAVFDNLDPVDMKRLKLDSEPIFFDPKIEPAFGANLGYRIVPNTTRAWKKRHPKKNLFKNLVLILNQSFIDYDFSSVSVHQFQRRTLRSAMETIFNNLGELSVPDQQSSLWTEIERIVGLSVIDPSTNQEVRTTLEGIQIYSYVPEGEQEIDADPLSGLGNLWSFNFFFCNPAAGKVVFIACSCRPRKFSQISDFGSELALQNSFMEAWDEQANVEDDVESNIENRSELGVAVAF